MSYLSTHYKTMLSSERSIVPYYDTYGHSDINLCDVMLKPTKKYM
jgi:hypothetical protein